MHLWTWDELLSACFIDPDAAAGVAPVVPDVTGISIDTRTLESGDLFIALSGAPGPGFHMASMGTSDGHDFVLQAQQGGATAIMAHREVAVDLPVLRVPDTLKGLWNLARFARQRMSGKVIAITGSSGKTTARACLQHVLNDVGVTHGATGSLNNHWGLPLSMARMPRNAEYGVFEIGMNHPGEIAPLAELASPDVALLLNVLPAHIGFFDSLDAIRQEKLTICNGLTDAGSLVVPDTLEALEVNPSIVTFGFTEQADIRCLGVEPLAVEPGSCRVSVDVAGTRFGFELGESGEHRVLTSLAVLAVCHVLGTDVRHCGAALATAQPPEGRGNRCLVDGICIIDDSYNANPASMAYALDNLGSMGQQQDHSSTMRRIAMLGDMLELGEHSADMHTELLTHCAGVDKVIAVGEQMYALYKLLPPKQQWFYVEKVSDIDMDRLCESLHAGDTILVKGSNKIFWAQDFVAELVDRIRKI